MLLERISVGGMAEVFKAKSFGVEGFEKILAIKRILPSLAEDSDFIEMFIDEAKICGQLNHANICQIFELGRVQDSHFIAMEFVWGKDLLQMQNRFRKQRQTMKPEMAAFIAAKLCEGLDYAHKKKDATGKPLTIIHRDISPQNILVSYEGELKIIDFGIAKAASRSSQTQAGVLKGKFGYMSPEQVRGLPLDRRSDVFAIGTILYEMLTADRLFIGDSDFETLERVRNVDVPPPSKANPSVPAKLEQIIMRALTRDVDERYQWASEMMEELQAFLMSYEPVFNAKGLAAWMRTSFGPEMKREQEILDEQRRVGKEVLTAPVAESFGVAASLISAQKPAAEEFPASSTRVVDDADLEFVDEAEEGAEKTTVSEPGAFAAMAAAVGGAPLPEQKTAILADNATAHVATRRPLNGSHPTEAGELPAQPTVILGDSSGVVPPEHAAVLRSGPQSSTLMAQPAPVLPPMNGAVGAPIAAHRTGQVVAPLPYAPAQRSTLWKDILIGVAVAAALVGGVLGVRAALSRSAAKGTLVIMAMPARAADVLIDGALRGRLDEGKPLTLKDLTAGPHAVVVRAADGAQFAQNVQLAAGDVSVLSAALGPPTPHEVGTGTLRLGIATDGAQVWVDGAQLADGAWKSPIPLRADVAHEIRVTKPAREEVKLAVTLKPGEELKRDIELMPAYAKIKVTSEPDGAEISVNGHRAGLTPTTLADLDPGKPARVTVKRKGFASVTKYVSFGTGLEQELDLKLVASGDDGLAEVAADPPEKVGKDKSKGAVLADISVDKPHGKDKKEDDPGQKSAVASNEQGFLVANTQPWAKVLIDGKDTGKTTPIAPRSKIALKPGKHVVTFVANGKKFNFDVVIRPAEDTRLIKQLSDSGP